MSYISAKYFIETPEHPAVTAEIIAGEQTTGTFVQIKGETQAIRDRCRARVAAVEILNESRNPLLLSAQSARTSLDETYTQAIVTIDFPADNIGSNLPTLIATLAGNIFELRELTGIRLLDFNIPASVSERFSSNSSGASNTFELCGVSERPIFGTIIKPNVGLSPEETADIVASVAATGLDFAKDDEVLADPMFNRFQARVEAVMRVINQHADETGKRLMYAFNISDDVDNMRRKLDLLHQHGASCAMVSMNWVGYAGVQTLRRHTPLPIHGHRNGIAAATRFPGLGWSCAAYTKSWRLAGVDQIHVNGLKNKFWEPDDSVISSARACTAPMGEIGTALPVFSSGQSAAHIPLTFQGIGTSQFMLLCGGGIFGHPLGPTSGVQSLLQAWEAASQGVELSTFATDHKELKLALEAFSR